MSPPYSSRNSPSSLAVRINGKIRAREVRVIGEDGQQMGVLQLSEALVLARNQGVDLVEIAANATPPVCKLIDYGKFRYEQSKKEKESRKHQHANKVKELQLSPTIDPHDFSVKLQHAIGFLCEEMKVKLSLRFRGREMAHTEYGFQQVSRFIKDLAPWGHQDANPKLIGRSIHVMISPLPRNKRAKDPSETGEKPATTSPVRAETETISPSLPDKRIIQTDMEERSSAVNFVNNPFSDIDVSAGR